jgi:hypothetical protein
VTDSSNKNTWRDATCGVVAARGTLGLAAPDSADKIRKGCANQIWRVLLEEVESRNRDLGLVRPCAAEVTVAAGGKNPGVAVDEKLWNVRFGKPG